MHIENPLLTKAGMYLINTANWFSTLTQVVYFDLTKLNTSNVTDMSYMFYESGPFSVNAGKLDLSRWDVSKVTNHVSFDSGVEDKVIAPNFN